ncbi:NirA family protein [Persicirhabdus sediminis]|uniref:NirA family protein n=1 Tax=Persicirhabdus sediminis TaxID=454144 RepID=A0A8J7SIR5_9BACT|nr:NirA family protein [Persicirhabdus sediminis]MBK1790814.1 NirA family protein [Persicirhabdus sediminis]
MSYIGPFTEEQKQYLAERVRTAYPFLGQNAAGQFTNDPEEDVYGTPVDDLCKEELIKYKQNGLDCWDTMCVNAAKDIFPDPDDMFRYKFYGMFHVKPAQDSFMLRCRIPGGQMNSLQFRGMAEMAADWGGNYTDITTRGNFQIREIMPRNVVNTLNKLTDLGLTSRGAGADNVRNVTATPTSGFDPQELIDVMPLARSMHHYIMNNRDLYGMPRKFNICFDSGGAVSTCADTNDIGFYAIEAGEEAGVEPGVYFRMQLCGITGHRQLASDCGVLLRPDECVPVAAAILRVFIENGDRTNRKKARLKYIVDDWGHAKLLEKVQEKLAFPLRFAELEKCAEMPIKDRQGHFGVHQQKQAGLNYVGVVTTVGRLLPGQMHAIADLADKYGKGDIRLTAWQNLIIPHIKDEDIPAFLDDLKAIGFSHTTTNVSGGLVACTGSEGCKLGAAATKSQSRLLAKYIEERVTLDCPLNIHLTGCPNSCAQHYIGDIGLQGAPCKVNGETVDGYHIVLGGGVDDNRAIAKDVFQSIPFTEVPDLIVRMLQVYLEKHEANEDFCAFTRRHSVEELRELFSPLAA